MKILLVTMSMRIGGAETHIYELARGLKKRGHEVHVASSGGVFAEKLMEMGISHETLPLDRRAPLAMLRAKKGLGALILREKYDIVHAHARIPAFLCASLYQKHRFRFVTTDHLDFKLTPLLKRLTDWGEFAFAVSEDLKHYLMEHYGVKEERIALTVNGIDTERFAPAPPDARLRAALSAGERPVILHISRLDAPVIHCASALMDAMPLLKREAVLVIVGDGDHAEELSEKADAVNERLGYSAVRLVGAISDVKPYILASDIIVSPSRAALEGMAAGKPTIVSGSQGHGGIFTEALAGEAARSNFCFRGYPLPTPEVLSSQIGTILDMSTEKREALGAACREHILENYSADIMVEGQLAVYEKLRRIPKGGEAEVMLAGYYGYGNLGDEALLSVMIERLRRMKPDVRICVLSADPEKTAKEHMTDAVHRFDIAAIAGKMQKGALFLFGGGTLLQDKTSNRSLMYYLYLIRMAKEKGMQTALFANGIGPLHSAKHRAAVGEALSGMALVLLRDRESLMFAEKYCEKENKGLMFDPAILMRKAPQKGVRAPVIYVILREMDRKTEKKLHFDLRLTLSSPRLTPISTPFRPVFLSLFDAEDGHFVQKTAQKFGAEYRSVSDPWVLVSLLQEGALVLSARLHGLVLAALAGVPMLPISGEEKLLSFMEMIGEGREIFSPETALSVLENSDKMREKLEKGLPVWCEMAEGGFDALEALLGRKG